MEGRFNEFGGQYVPETVMNALIELEDAYKKVIDDKEFMEEYMI
jgi:tryptophan synthase beta chain